MEIKLKIRMVSQTRFVVYMEMEIGAIGHEIGEILRDLCIAACYYGRTCRIKVNDTVFVAGPETTITELLRVYDGN